MFLVTYTASGGDRCLLEMSQSPELGGYMQAVCTLLRDQFWVMGAPGVSPEAMQTLVATKWLYGEALDFFSAEKSILFPKAIEAQPNKTISNQIKRVTKNFTKLLSASFYFRPSALLFQDLFLLI